MNSSAKYGNWICCQIGAREHYAVPRVLSAASLLGALITDAWISPKSVFGAGSLAGLARLRGRYHSELCSAKVFPLTLSFIGFELRSRLLLSLKFKPWSQMLSRNRWFQQRGVKLLRRLAPQLEKAGKQVTLFAYSYAALALFQFAKQRGWRTILGQIDGGRRDEEIIAAECTSHSDMKVLWHPAPPEYWRTWESECALADRIVVNSEWSSKLLIEANIAPEKLHVIPVAYESTGDGQTGVRDSPAQFSVSRPLRVLFLGAFALRKGAAAVLNAMRLLQNEPIEFWIVGAVGVDIPLELRNSAKVKWIGPVSREATSEHYRNADLFLFPTISDGFGMTQVEARGWKLPIIATPFCARIVKHDVNGFVIPKSDGILLAEAIRSLIIDPKTLRRLSIGTVSEYDEYSLETVKQKYLALNG